MISPLLKTSPRPLSQKREQPEVGRSELDGLAVDRHLVAREVEPEPPDLP